MKMKDVLCIHHTDLDGAASAAILAYYMNNKFKKVDFVAFNYGDKIPSVEDYREVWLVDVSLGKNTVKILNEWRDNNIRVGWIDHHKTVIEEEDKVLVEDGKSIMGWRKTGEAACVLTWKYFFPNENVPSLIAYLGAYDIWDKESFNWASTLRIQYGIRSLCGMKTPENILDIILRAEGYGYNMIPKLITSGGDIINFLHHKNKSECEQFAFEANIFVMDEMLVKKKKAICINSLEFNSTTFDSIYDEDKHDMMIVFAYTPNKTFRFSLYTTKDDVDCGEIAKMMGGGGHKGAAGFHLGLLSATRFLENRELLIEKME